MPPDHDRLLNLLPTIYRLRDDEQGGPLGALLAVLNEQVDVVDRDIAQLYDDWFIETCASWVVPYIGDLVGYRPVAEAGLPARDATPEGRLRNQALESRREVANTVAYRRRRGTLALLELLAGDVAGWPARAVEFYRLVVWAQHMALQRRGRAGTASLTDAAALDLCDGAFDCLPRTVDLRAPDSALTRGRYNVPSVGLFVWRLRPYSITRTLAYCREQDGEGCYTFSVLGNDAPLFTKPQPEATPTHIAEEINVPAPIRRLALARDLPAGALYYGAGRSFQIWAGRAEETAPTAKNLIQPDRLIAADLDRWFYQPPEGHVAVDPVRGRFAFARGEAPEGDVWVSYHYGMSADLGGGEYHRRLTAPPGAKLYHVSQQGSQPGWFATLASALGAWRTDKPTHAVIEIMDSGVYTEALEIRLREGQSLQIRAANGVRPVLRFLDQQTARVDSLATSGAGAGGRLTFHGLLVAGRGLTLSGELACVTIRHCTLVPGWDLESDCTPKAPQKPSIAVHRFRGRLQIDHSIVGALHLFADEVRQDPIDLSISDSVVDATVPTLPAIAAPPGRWAHASLTLVRSTVIGAVDVHAIALAENAIVLGPVHVARRQTGCVRFCFVPRASRTPRRFQCQPDLAEAAAEAALRKAASDAKLPVPAEAAIQAARLAAARAVSPLFVSLRYGAPTYAQLADGCAVEIRRGADDESELGAFHDLFQPQREAVLQARLDESIPAGTRAGVFHAT